MHHISCAYCGKAERKCRYSKYKAGELLIEVETTLAQGTLGGMRELFESQLGGLPDHIRGAWRFSFTEFPDQAGEYPGLDANCRTVMSEEDTEASVVIEMKRKEPSGLRSL